MKCDDNELLESLKTRDEIKRIQTQTLSLVVCVYDWYSNTRF